MSLFDLLGIFLRLGLTSFGGPVAHLGYFHEEFVKRRCWFTEEEYGDLTALCQFLPGPSSSQLCFAIGLKRSGLLGGLAALAAFTLPSALIMTLFAYGMVADQGALSGGWLHGLKVAAVAVVAQAVWSMAGKLCTDKPRIAMALMSAGLILLSAQAWLQPLLILLGAIAGWLMLSKTQAAQTKTVEFKHGKFHLPMLWLVLFFVLLVGLPTLARTTAQPAVKLLDSFYRSGSLVFGGGHVVLPLLQKEVVTTGWVSQDQFLAGYGAAQALPGPLFSFAAYLGGVMNPASAAGPAWLSAILCLLAIYLPGLLLVLGVLPLWEQLKTLPAAQASLAGANATVVGLLLAALFHPVWTGAILQPRDFVLALLLFGMLQFWKCPSWIVVVLAAATGTMW